MSDRPRHERFALRIARLLHADGEIVAGTLGSIALAIWGAVSPGNFTWIWLVLGILLVIVSLVVRWKRKPSYDDLVEQKDNAEAMVALRSTALEEALGSMLRRIATHCEITGVDQRLSVYCHYDKVFSLLARVAKRSDYEARGRATYPADQGVIGQAWRDGSAGLQLADKAQWVVQTMKFGFSREEAEALVMKSKSIYAVRLEHNFKNVGVLVMESDLSGGITGHSMEQIQSSLLVEALAETLYAAGPYFPNAVTTDEVISPVAE